MSAASLSTLDLRYPRALDDDLRGSGLSEGERREVLATAWEYVRCGVPEFTDPERYLTFVQLTALTTVAEYRGELIDVDRVLDPDGLVLGYPVRRMLDYLFEGTGVTDTMAREYASSLLFMAAKTTQRYGDLQRRFVEALASSPATYFRLRDCDAQVRFFIAAAAACNNIAPTFREGEYRAMAEIGMTLYDAVAYYKHRAEGEPCNLFGHCGPDLKLRQEAYRTARDTLWRLETRWYRTVEGRCAINLLRNLPLIHMAMSRYRFVEDGLAIGRPETSDVVRDARAHVKLWYRNDAQPAEGPPQPAADNRTVDSVRHMLYPELAAALERTAGDVCPQCTRHPSYGATAEGQFGGVTLCGSCRHHWWQYLLTSGPRHAEVLSLRT